MLSLKQTVPARSAVITRSINVKPANTANTMLAVSALAGMLSLSACQTAPTVSTAMKTVPTQTLPSSQKPKASIATVTQAPIVRPEEESDYPIEPYNSSEPYESTNPLTQETPVFTPSNPVLAQPNTVIIMPSPDDYIISEPSAPSHNELLEQARKNSQQRTQKAATNNSNLPAFRNLMQTGISQLKAGKLTNAENSFTRAQRLAPKSSAVYFYLAQIALKKNQPRKAEAMARRGLSVSQDTSRRRALWQIILQSGQAQGNARVISEAKQALR
ncbi:MULTISPECIES: tetratricopeptide repeat protein [Psychrobacter]|uniref:tetratricopeptide repeat protein n=1 Tax=Psychrobacter TaxID=497 RepID=UPI001D00CB60|nr:MULTISPECIES: tetratricopeptide repeat protein [Psychrobacter]